MNCLWVMDRKGKGNAFPDGKKLPGLGYQNEIETIFLPPKTVPLPASSPRLIQRLAH